MWQPESAGHWPDQPDEGDGRPRVSEDPQPAEASPRGRRRRRVALFAVILAAGLGGLAVSAFGIAHQLLPRQFTHAQQRQITSWQIARRWRADAVGKIFPWKVSYEVSGYDLDSATGLVLDARRLGVATGTGCSTGVTGKATAILATHGCTAVLRATYVDASGSIVATVAVAVLPDPAAAHAVSGELAGPHGSSPPVVQPLPIARTAAAGFHATEVSDTTSSGSYVIMSTAGFADGRRKVPARGDQYADQEMVSLIQGLSASAGKLLGHPPPAPSCPGSPGC